MAFPKISKHTRPAFEAALPHDPRVVVRSMFGGMAAMVHGHMFAGLWADTAVIRVGEADRAAVLAMDGGAEFDPMGRGKPMANMVLLPPSEMDDDEALRGWFRKALEHTASLPPKAAKKTSAKKTPAKKTPAKKPAARAGR